MIQMRRNRVSFSSLYSAFRFHFPLYLIRNGLYIFHAGWCIWMIRLQDQITVKNINSHFTKRFQSKLRIKYYGLDKLRFSFDKSSKVKNV